MITATICFSVLASGAVARIEKVLNPSSNVDSIIRLVSDTMNTLIGLLAGFIAGRTQLNKPRDNQEADQDDVTKPYNK
jgi:hypothetical protein